MYQNHLIHGETTGQLDDDNRFLEIRTGDDGNVVLHTEDDVASIELPMTAHEALALIAALTAAVQTVV
jgi:hypothetical protein